MNHVVLLSEMRNKLTKINNALCGVQVSFQSPRSYDNLRFSLECIDELRRETDEALSAVPASKEEEERIQKAVDENDGRIDVVDDDKEEADRQMRELPDKIENAFRNIPGVQSPDGTIWYNYYHLVHLFIDMEDWADTIRDYMNIASEETDKRNPGFYWVCYGDEWTVAEYNREMDQWFVVGSDDVYEEDEFEQIGNRLDSFGESG